jgi:hypothetical protein
MTEISNDFKIFFNLIFDSVVNFYNWYIGTFLGEILIFIIVIGLFLTIIEIIIGLRKLR